jgi:hypothetical protein
MNVAFLVALVNRGTSGHYIIVPLHLVDDSLPASVSVFRPSSILAP